MDFNKQWSADGHLEFVINGGSEPVATIIDITAVSYSFQPVSSAVFSPVIAVTAHSDLALSSNAASIDVIVDMQASSELSYPVGEHEIEFDINVDRGPKVDVSSAFERAIDCRVQISNQFADSPKLDCMQTAALMGRLNYSNPLLHCRRFTAPRG